MVQKAGTAGTGGTGQRPCQRAPTSLAQFFFTFPLIANADTKLREDIDLQTAEASITYTLFLVLLLHVLTLNDC